MNQIRTIKGTHDILPENSKNWQRLEKIIHNNASLYGYEEIRTPIIEEAGLFNRGIGQDTDIVSKEMYSWEDRNGDNISLRPELTAPTVRAFIEHNLEKLNYDINVTKRARKLLTKLGFHNEYGARNLRRTIQNYIEDSISELLLENKFVQGDKITVDVKQNEFTFSSNQKKNVHKRKKSKNENPQKV